MSVTRCPALIDETCNRLCRRTGCAIEAEPDWPEETSDREYHEKGW